MNIIIYPHEILRQKAERVMDFDDNLKKTVEEMFELMYAKKGIGLAANQVGINKQLFITDAPFMDKKNQKVFINPKMTIGLNPRPVKLPEGCLSLPGLVLEVERPSRDVLVEWQDINGFPEKQTFSGYTARVIQHEYDHIQGILFYEKVPMTDYIADFLEKLSRV